MYNVGEMSHVRIGAHILDKPSVHFHELDSLSDWAIYTVNMA